MYIFIYCSKKRKSDGAKGGGESKKVKMEDSAEEKALKVRSACIICSIKLYQVVLMPAGSLPFYNNIA